MKINEITINELQEQYRNKTLSVKEVVQEYIERIHRLDQGDHGLNSVLEVNPEAITIAEELDRSGNEEGRLLYGVPVLLKDNIATADHMHTSAGTVALADSYAGYDADIVTALRRNGAVILGKANMTELANYMTQNMPGGYSSRGGQVIAPYNREKDATGSSTGSAVAVATNLCAASIGSDTCNSIVAPGLVHGIVGLRPSTGVLSQKGIIPISFTLDTAGPFTRSVEDCAIMYAGLTDTPVITGEGVSLKGMTIGYNDWNPGTIEDTIAVRTEQAIKELERKGAKIKRLQITKTQHIKDLMRYEFKYAINKYLETLPGSYPIKSLKDIIEYNNRQADIALRYGQTYLLDAEENTSGRLDEAVYREVLQDRLINMKQIREQLQGMDLCVMLSYNNILQYVGLPVITLPTGLYEDGMPSGIYMTALSDDRLIRNAYAVEKAIGQRIEPGISSSI